MENKKCLKPPTRLSCYIWLVVSTYPSEKWWTSSVGMMTFPTYWKKKSSKPPTRYPFMGWDSGMGFEVAPQLTTKWWANLRCGWEIPSDSHAGHLCNSHFYPLVNIQKTMENHHFLWVNQLFLRPFSIAMLVYQRAYRRFLNHLQSCCCPKFHWHINTHFHLHFCQYGLNTQYHQSNQFFHSSWFFLKTTGKLT